MSSNETLKQIIEAALLAAGRPLNLDQLQALFEKEDEPEKNRLREILAELTEDYQGRGIEIREVGNGFRIQVRSEFSPWVSKLWDERPPKYSRALLETLALIAYRQPITRGEIEDVRGVSVSTNIVKTLTEREWVRVVGHRDVPGKPALYATTKEFLDYFNLKGLSELPTLAEIRDLDSINRELELKDPDKLDEEPTESEQTPDEVMDAQPVVETDQLDENEILEDESGQKSEYSTVSETQDTSVDAEKDELEADQIDQAETGRLDE
ncbi:MAG: SMC-Scp complex subunit ScpB [endosymbiont of Seepiophila jonesi]|uniref:SMC-Scp complex subunit ScpB n=1 Tax=endosymbiont of Lamellibrachia luymesi TaxID=2200907 RepID=A0A370DPR1_9GAMM|nr:MAG: SMC-Scp complex subunit ScpB [endosymbiont of Lamellibrachia luymesi]RDH93136.1 MAG: SMC-Scp complex subunit ScpB [endosymbiont of Seepiophila jonesi]